MEENKNIEEELNHQQPNDDTIPSSNLFIETEQPKTNNEKQETNNEKQETETMEVHTHPHAHAKKNLKQYFWEFLMLFLAVFCGFLAEYQLEHKIEKDREKQFINSLVTDLIEDSLTFDKSIQSMNTNVARMDTLLNLLNDPNIRNFGSELYYLGRKASRSSWVTLNDRTIQQMKNSGGFRLIRKEKAAKAIMEYYSKLNFIEMLQTVEINEQNEYKRIAIDVFHPVIFDSIVVMSDNLVKKPVGNPALLTYEPGTLMRLAGMISYMKSSRLGLAKAQREMQTAASDLIAVLKQEYHLK